jgi:hypothetical protein
MPYGSGLNANKRYNHAKTLMMRIGKLLHIDNSLIGVIFG